MLGPIKAFKKALALVVCLCPAPQSFAFNISPLVSHHEVWIHILGRIEKVLTIKPLHSKCNEVIYFFLYSFSH